MKTLRATHRTLILNLTIISERCGYLTIVPALARVGYAMIDNQRGAELAIIISWSNGARVE